VNYDGRSRYLYLTVLICCSILLCLLSSVLYLDCCVLPYLLIKLHYSQMSHSHSHIGDNNPNPRMNVMLEETTTTTTGNPPTQTNDPHLHLLSSLVFPIILSSIGQEGRSCSSFLIPHINCQGLGAFSVSKLSDSQLCYFYILKKK